MQKVQRTSPRGAEGAKGKPTPRAVAGSLNVQVVLRVRPLIKEDSPESCLDMEPQRVLLHDPRHKGTDREYDFDHIYGPDSTTTGIFAERIEPCLDGLLKGLSTYVFAHGATGSGKTFTMEGLSDGAGTLPGSREPGIVGMAATRLFAQLAEEPAGLYRVTVSLFEIHRDKVRDLVDTTGTKEDLAMREDMNGTVQIADLTEVEVKNVAALMQTYATGVSRRVMAKTGLNEVSSRSHCCFQIKVAKQEPEKEPEKVGRTPMSYHVKPKPKVEGKLFLIDLAGFEDNRQTDNAGDRMHESRTINTSHFTLGKCFLSLKRGELRVPYRDNKLTRLLGAAFQGKSALALMLVTVCPNLSRFQAVYNTFTCIQLEGRPVGGPRGPAPAVAAHGSPKGLSVNAVAPKESAVRRKSPEALRKSADHAPEVSRKSTSEPSAAMRRKSPERGTRPAPKKMQTRPRPALRVDTSTRPLQQSPAGSPREGLQRTSPPFEDVRAAPEPAPREGLQRTSPTGAKPAPGLQRPRVGLVAPASSAQAKPTAKEEKAPAKKVGAFFRAPAKKADPFSGVVPGEPSDSCFRGPASAGRAFFSKPLPSVMSMLGFPDTSGLEDLPPLPPVQAVEYPSLHPPALAEAFASRSRLPTPKSTPKGVPTMAVNLAAEAAREVVAELEPLTLPEEEEYICAPEPDENATERTILRLLNGSKPEMQQLKQIGEQRADEIVQFREMHGPLTSLDQLHEIGLKAFKPKAFLDANRAYEALELA